MEREMIRSGADRFAAEENPVWYADAAQILVILYDREAGVIVALDPKVTKMNQRIVYSHREICDNVPLPGTGRSRKVYYG